MKTLLDYVRGYPYVPVLLIAQHLSKGERYLLCKEETHDTFFFMKGEEVVLAKRFTNDAFPKLSIAHINNKKDIGIISEIENCASYRAFVKFVKEQTGEDFILDRVGTDW